METLTIKEALNQGYEKCGIEKQEWQCLTNIEDLTDEDLKDGYYVAQNQPNYFSFNKQQISELLSETIDDQYSNETGRDDEEIYNAIKEIDFSQTEKLIEETLKKFPYWYLTKIKLVTNPQHNQRD